MESELQQIVRTIMKMVESGDVLSLAFAIEHKHGHTSSAFGCEDGCDTMRLIGALSVLQGRLIAEYNVEPRCEEHKDS